MTEKENKRYLFWLINALVFFTFIYLIRSILLPFILGAAIAYFLDPAADRLERAKFSRISASGLIIASFFIVFGGLLVLITPILAHQLSALIADIPNYLAIFEARYEPQFYHYIGNLPDSASDSLKEAASNMSGGAVKYVGSFVTGVFMSGMAVANVFSLILITPVVAFYLLRDWDVMVAKLHLLLPRPHAKTIREQMHLIDQTLAGFLRGQINVCLIMGVFFAVGLSLAGLKFGILIGLLTGFLMVLPYVGFLFGAGAAVLVAFFQFGSLEAMVPVIAVLTAGQLLESNIITPKLVGEKVGLHPVWIIFGLLAGAALFGFVGVLIAVPTTAIIGVLLRFAISKYLQSSYYLGRKKTAEK